jgi:uncharacterized membrane protein
MLGELLPWNRPLIMFFILKLRPPLKLGFAENHFVSAIIDNAGIYNGIVLVAYSQPCSRDQVHFWSKLRFLTGGIVAGLFGAATLTRRTIAQAFSVR